MMFVPATVVGTVRCPMCNCIRLSLIDHTIEGSLLDPNGFPIDTYEYSISFIYCHNCHSRHPYLGNGIDGFSIDDGIYTDEPEFEKQTVVFNPFYKRSGYF